MKRKALVVLFFIVVFGLPVCWYLFLQAFGENKFALPVLSTYESTCDSLSFDKAGLLVDADLAKTYPNEFARIDERLNQESNLQLVLTSCEMADDMMLVDHENQVRGIYDLNREEVDRLLAEIDIYLMNLNHSKREGK
ncbi:hypothetical protein [Marinoscillum furvescens]|uniref:Uncharacterized protein n=1 Tax=Marinoscillum furvescens DSM 4134 TaxID=1122208 RepID=A0A3D9L134_MARFU|nr:hypothetical protein [Marinoscillum furvescens]RED96239.1 hypothetical protein C7460_115130 [Marinoscillum furvescens DSM 4134]